MRSVSLPANVVVRPAMGNEGARGGAGVRTPAEDPGRVAYEGTGMIEASGQRNLGEKPGGHQAAA
jgi:hypothetical protein